MAVNLIPQIVYEASDADDRKYIRSMNKHDLGQINADLMQRLYKNMVEFNTVDFGEIPDSKGDIEKLKCYKPTVECLDVVEQLMKQNKINEPALGDTRLAISNIIQSKSHFEEAFKLNQEYIILVYNTSVMAVLDVTRLLITEYVNYMTGPNSAPFKLTGRTDKSRGLRSLECLRTFNKLVKDNTVNDTFVGLQSASNLTGELAIPFVVIGGLVTILTLSRQLILYFYQSRVRLSDYLEMEAMFLEANKLSVEASKLPLDKKKKVLLKQEKVILKLRRLADGLKIKMEDADVSSRTMEKKQNASWSLKNIEKDMTEKKLNDGQMTINII